MGNDFSFKPGTVLGNVLLRWWQGLDENRGARAELRRAPNLTAVALTRAFQHFYRLLLESGFPEPGNPETSIQTERLAAIAGLLAQVKTLDTKSLPLAMSEGERPSVSELRFRRLLDAPSIDDLFVSLRRTLPLIGYQANIYELADAVRFWGDQTKKKWAYNYRWPAKAHG